jgi:hypothetical protein
LVDYPRPYGTIIGGLENIIRELFLKKLLLFFNISLKSPSGGFRGLHKKMQVTIRLSKAAAIYKSTPLKKTCTPLPLQVYG